MEPDDLDAEEWKDVEAALQWVAENKDTAEAMRQDKSLCSSTSTSTSAFSSSSKIPSSAK